MKKYLVLLGMILFFLGCYINYSQKLDYYPSPPDDLYGPMKSLLLEIGYKITTEAPHPDAVLAAMGYKDPYLIGEKDQLKVMATFRRIQAETQVEIHVSQIGKIAIGGDALEMLDRIRDEIAAKFKEKMGR